MSKKMTKKILALTLSTAIAGSTVIAIPAMTANAVQSGTITGSVTEDKQINIDFDVDGEHKKDIVIPVKLNAEQVKAIVENVKTNVAAMLEEKLPEEIKNSSEYAELMEKIAAIPEEELQKFYDALVMLSEKLADAIPEGEIATVEFTVGEYGMVMFTVEYNDIQKSFVIPTDFSRENLLSLTQAVLLAAKESIYAKIPDETKMIIEEYEQQAKAIIEKIEGVVTESAEKLNAKAVELYNKLSEKTGIVGLRDVGRYAFYDFDGLENISLSGTTEEIGALSFFGAKGFSRMEIPDSVQTIGSYAFYDCDDLEEVVLPESVTSIGKGAFRSCNKNLKFYVKANTYAEEFVKKNKFNYDTVLDLKVDVPEYSYVGDGVTVEALATGGAGDYTYSIKYTTPDGTEYTPVEAGSAENQVFIAFDKKGEYNIDVEVTDADGCVYGVTKTVTVKAELKNKTTVNAETVKVGEKIVLKGAASGGVKGYKYAFYYKKSKNTEWLPIVEAYTTKSIAFKPGKAVPYDVKSIVMDANGKTAEVVYTVKVTE